MLSGKVLREQNSFLTAMSCVLMVLAVLIGTSAGAVAGEPKTVAEIALYQGADREKILLEGARKEGQLTFYNTHNWFKTVAKEFEKKYPFIKVSEWRSDGQTLIKRVMEEFAGGRYLVDVIDGSTSQIIILHREGIFQEYFSPAMLQYGDKLKAKGKNGVYYLAERELYIGLGFNTKRIPPGEAPKTLKDLLDPKWKGKMSITGTDTGIRWVGNALEAMGRDFIEKLSLQDVKIQNISGAALAGLVVSGEVPLSPTIFDSTLVTAKQKGASVEWRPLEPVLTNVGHSGITTKAPHPHTALLFLDYLHSKEGQQVVMQGGLSSPRTDIGTLAQKFKKIDLEAKYKSVEEFEKKFNEWESLMKRTFIRK